ncbi:MAG: glycosyltransferase family 2 protein [Planctomycetaceae bacterium]
MQRLETASGPCPTVSAIVPVYNGGPAFVQCLESLRAAIPPIAEILVIDDGSTDGSDRVAQQFAVTLLQTGGRRGPAVARNQGARAARGDLLFFVDADVTMPPGALEVFMHLFDGASGVDAVIGSYDDAPAELNLLSQYKNLLHHYVHQQAASEGFTFWGACGVIRRSVFLEVGGFDERYRQPSIEDIELGYRLRSAGRRIRVCKPLQVKHWKRWDACSLFKTDVFQRAWPWSKLLLRVGKMENDLNISHASRARVALACTLPVVTGAGWLWPPALALAAILVISLLVLDVPVLKFFWQKRGFWFAVRTIPWHWLSHVYSGAAFAAALVRHVLPERRRATQSAAPCGPRGGV